jgi:hypothetical protein
VDNLFTHFQELNPDRFSTQIQEVRDEIRQGADSAERDDPAAALVHLRKALECVVRHVFEGRTRESAGTRPLENLLQLLVKEGHLDDPEATYATAVKELGNLGAHWKRKRPKRADVLQCLRSLVPVLEWYCEQEDLDSDPEAGDLRRNPYDPAAPASAAVFAGREGLKRQLVRGLLDGSSYSLDGPPGIGKTCFLLALEWGLLAAQARPAAGTSLVPLFLDCDPGRYGALDVFLQAVIKSLNAVWGERCGLACPPRLLERGRAEARKGRLNDALQPLLDWALDRDRRVHRPVLLLDDFHRLGGRRWLPELDSLLEGLVNRHVLAVVLTTSPAPPRRGRDDVSGLHELLFPCALAPLTREETHALVELARKNGWDVEKGCAAEAHKRTGGHPQQLQRLLYSALAVDNRLTVAGLSARCADARTADD